MKRFLPLCWACMFGVLLFAQDSPVLMRINGKDVTRSEFESAYRHYSMHSDKKLTSKEYAEIFIGRKLMVTAAKTAGMDTVSIFRKQQETYRATLLKSFLMDERATDSCARAFYYKMKTSGRTDQVQMMQIVKYLPQNTTSRKLNIEQMRMDSIYRVIISQSGTIDFPSLVERYSDDKRCVWITGLQTTSEFENIAFSLNKGEVSKPFLTPEGIHILKVVDKKSIPDYDTVSNQLTERVRRVPGLDKATEVTVKRLKNESQYTTNSAGIDELLVKGETKLTLFSIEGNPYTGGMFKRFASAHPQTTKRQLNGFIAKSLLDYESKNVEKKHPDVYKTLQEYEEDALVLQLTRERLDLPTANDRAGLSTYFEFHKSDYRWDTPRFRGIVLHCADKKSVKSAKKMLKKVPERQWTDTLRKTFNTFGVETIKVEQGLFADGDNKYIDKLVFKKGNYDPVMSYPFTVAIGKKMKGPEDYWEAIEQVRKDYRNYLDVRWKRELRDSGKVEINQEVLKTVNND